MSHTCSTFTVGCERRELQGSELPATGGFFSTGNHSIISEPCTKYEGNKAPVPPKELPLPHFSNINPTGRYLASY